VQFAVAVRSCSLQLKLQFAVEVAVRSCSLQLKFAVEVAVVVAKRPWRLSRSLFFVGILLGCHWGSLAPGAATALGARGHDRGPEPSLRTSPASSSSPPLAVPSDSVGLIDAPRAECRGHTRLAVSNGLGRWDGRISWRFCDELSPVEDLAGPALRRPRGRPCNAYAMRCVSGGALRAGGEPWAEVCVARWWRVLGRSVQCAMVESSGQNCALRYAPNGALGVAPACRLCIACWRKLLDCVFPHMRNF